MQTETIEVIVAERVTSDEDARALKNNTVIGTPKSWGKLTVEFNGIGNVLVVEEGANLKDGKISFGGNNGVVVLRSSNHFYCLDVTVWSNTILYIDENCYFNGRLHAIASEGKSMLIGRECYFSTNIWIRTGDVHIVYDASSHGRLNLSKDVVIGDHVWIGQDVMILKGSQIGSGSIIGAKSLVAGKKVNSNASWGGNPAKKIRDGVFWDGVSSNDWNSEQTKKSLSFPGDQFIYSQDESTLCIDTVLESIQAKADAASRVAAIQETLFAADKNRFYLPSQNTSPKDDSVGKGEKVPHSPLHALKGIFR
jgi:acetyltransferase-like isoleucine patch superfamily enzyme